MNTGVHPTVDTDPERILVLAPTARDAAITASLLAEAGFRASFVADVPALVAALGDGAGALLLTEELEASAQLPVLLRGLNEQPEWSEVPVIVLASPARERSAFPRLSAAPGLTILERPIRTRTLVSALSMALRARRRQYELRAQLEAGRRLQSRLADELAGMHRLHAVASRLARPSPLEPQLHDMLRAALELTQADAAAFELDPGEQGRRVRAHAGFAPATACALEARGSLLGAGPLPAIGPTHWTLEELALGSLADRAALAALADAGFARVMLAPFRSARSASTGCLTVAWRSPAPPAETAGLWLELLGHLTDALLERARHEDERRLADRRKDEFLATLAHELRNPLAPVRNATRILASSAVEVRERDWAVRVIDRQVRTMARLLDDLLDLSRITRGKLDLQRTRVTLASIVDAAVETVRPLVDARGHRLEVVLPEQEVWLDADGVRLAQVLGNLLTNAAKYTDDGGRVQLVAERVGAEIRVRVTDTGIGLDPAALAHVFEMFSQVESARGRSEGGLGIGLALVRGIVHLHGGRIEADSAGPGAGSEFRVWLPCADAGSAGGAPVVEPETGPRRRRVLVADDNVDAAESLALILQLAGHTVDVEHDGAAALARLRSAPYDGAILDIGMPRLDGYGVARAIRAEARAPLLLIAVTGWGQEKDRSQALAAGFDLHLTKPVDPVALERALAAVPPPAPDDADAAEPAARHG